MMRTRQWERATLEDPTFRKEGTSNSTPIRRLFAAFHAKAGFQLSIRLHASGIAQLLLSPENRIFSSLGDPQFEHGFRWNPDPLARFRILGLKPVHSLASSFSSTGAGWKL